MLRPMARISPSRAYSLDKCALREVLLSNRVAPLLPTSPTARLGSVIHGILEEAAKGSINDRQTFEEVWEKHLKRVESQISRSLVEAHLVPLMDSARDYEVKKLQAWRLIRLDFVDRHPVKTINTHVGSEVWLQSHDAKVAGRVDLLVKNGGYCELIDYKTGVMVDGSGCIRKEYQLQMKLYAALYHESEGKWPSKLTIIGIDQKRLEISFEASDCERLLEGFTAKLAILNRRILENAKELDLSTPNPETCKYCSYRPTCSNYWNQRTDSGDWPNDVRGTVMEETVSGIGLIRLVIEDNCRQHIVRGLSSRHSLPTSGLRKLLVCNLSKEKSSGQLVENQMTTCFPVD